MSNNRTPLPPTEHDRKPGQIDESRRRFGKAGLGSSAVLLTLAGRPVLGATCLTPSMAGSGNHSQHGGVTCYPSKIFDPISGSSWIDRAVGYKVGDSAPAKWPGYKPDDPFHPFFTQGSYLNYSSYTFIEVLVGRVWPNNKTAPIPSSATILTAWPDPLNPALLTPPTDPAELSQYFVSALLDARADKYLGMLKDQLPDPSVQGIVDEYARKGYFEPYAGKKWYGGTILAYLKDPGSVF